MWFGCVLRLFLFTQLTIKRQFCSKLSNLSGFCIHVTIKLYNSTFHLHSINHLFIMTTTFSYPKWESYRHACTSDRSYQRAYRSRWTGVPRAPTIPCGNRRHWRLSPDARCSCSGRGPRCQGQLAKRDEIQEKM